MHAVPCLIVALALAALAPAAQAATATCRGFNGTWTTDYGVMRLRAGGATAAGDYSWSGLGTITGRLAGDAVTGRWKDGTGDGTLSLKLSPGGRAFTGTWKRNSGTGNAGGKWNGTCGGVMPAPVAARPARPPPSAARPAGPAPSADFQKALR
jgi:hypothetical protein